MDLDQDTIEMIKNLRAKLNDIQGIIQHQPFKPLDQDFIKEHLNDFLFSPDEFIFLLPDEDYDKFKESEVYQSKSESHQEPQFTLYDLNEALKLENSQLMSQIYHTLDFLDSIDTLIAEKECLASFRRLQETSMKNSKKSSYRFFENRNKTYSEESSQEKHPVSAQQPLVLN